MHQIDLEKGLARKRKALNDHERKRKIWLDRTRQLLQEKYLADGRPLSANDVWSINPPPEGVHPSVLGAVFKTKNFIPVGYTQSSGADAHARQIRTYEWVRTGGTPKTQRKSNHIGREVRIGGPHGSTWVIVGSYPSLDGDTILLCTRKGVRSKRQGKKYVQVPFSNSRVVYESDKDIIDGVWYFEESMSSHKRWELEGEIMNCLDLIDDRTVLSEEAQESMKKLDEILAEL